MNSSFWSYIVQMEKLRLNDKSRITRLIFLLVTVAVAIFIVSSTIGREMYEQKGQSLMSFGVIHFSGYLFFLLMPVEMAFIYYLSYFGETEMFALALATAVPAQLIDYLIGCSFSSGFLSRMVGQKRILKAEKYIMKYGNLTIFAFNFLPLSSPVISLAAGMLRYKFSVLMLYSITGLIFKYLLLMILF